MIIQSKKPAEHYDLQVQQRRVQGEAVNVAGHVHGVRVHRQDLADSQRSRTVEKDAIEISEV